ncbi:MAG: hypothetical protein OEP95_10880, partial [Myxococcales bacterium]|nr:hypothetical protein [Myxococcales bacterium]
VTSPGTRTPNVIDSIGLRAGIIPYWNMYAVPPRFDVSFRAIGKLENGASIELTKADGAGGWRDVRKIHEYIRFRRYLVQITAPKEAPALKNLYLRWLCRSWNADQPEATQAKHVTLVQTRTQIRPAGEPRDHRLARVVCSAPATRAGPQRVPGLSGREESRRNGEVK